VAFSGTYNSNQPSLAASKACLEELRDGEVSRRLAHKSAQLKDRVDEVAERLDRGVQFQTMAGQFQVYFASSPVKNYRDAAAADAQRYRALCDAMFRKGVLVSQFYLFHNGISAAHDDDDIETLVSSIEEGLGRSVR
jgi:glutamate-1-semialdehyde 2,1-aminomutase